MVSPRVVKSIQYEDEQYDIPILYAGYPISSEIAEKISNMLSRSIIENHNIQNPDGYRFAGDSGVAEIPTAMGYTSDRANVSFVGWGPIDDYKIIIFIGISGILNAYFIAYNQFRLLLFFVTISGLTLALHFILLFYFRKNKYIKKVMREREEVIGKLYSLGLYDKKQLLEYVKSETISEEFFKKIT